MGYAFQITLFVEFSTALGHLLPVGPHRSLVNRYTGLHMAVSAKCPGTFPWAGTGPLSNPRSL